MIKLIAMDMDGTLLNPQHVISAENAKALREARAAGIHICLCSGRMPNNLSDLALQAGVLDAHILALNGGCRLDSPKGRIVTQHFLSKEALEECKAIIDATGFDYYAHHTDYMAKKIPFANQEAYAAWLARRDFREFIRVRSGEAAVNELIEMGANKLVCFEYVRVEELQALRKRLEAQAKHFEVTSSWFTNIEIMPRGINKGSSVMQLAADLRLTRDEVMTIGDNDNDLSMIQAAGCGVCMGNGMEHVKQAADYVTGTNAEDGVAQAIYRLALGQSV